MVKKFKNNSAITLISLVITIVVIIILAGVGIYLGLSQNGIFNRANEAKELTNKQTATDIINLKITTAQMNKYADDQRMPTLKELSETLRNDNEIQYVTEKSQIASIKYEVGENPSSIFTKLNEYSYEFEINSSLQLASIDGVKLATTQDNNSAKLFDYSNSDEKVIGTWYNGKTMYELSIPITITSTSTTGTIKEKYIDLSSYNIDECIVFDGYYKYNSTIYPLPIFVVRDNSVRVNFSTANNSLTIYNSIKEYSNAPGYVTLHYTKKDISE